METKQRFTKVLSTEHLKHILSDGKKHEFVLLLNNGAKSAKTMSFDVVQSKFYIVSHNNGDEQLLTEAELSTKSAIGAGILREALWQENCDV